MAPEADHFLPTAAALRRALRRVRDGVALDVTEAAVLLDTLIVRSVLVTAINLDLGGRIWWPSALDRKPPVVPPAADEYQEPEVPVSV